MIIALHAGAGAFTEPVEQFCADALKNLANEKNARHQDSFLVEAIMVIKDLERCPALNCGLGSNLTIAGTVECEAAYMASEGLSHGAVAVVTHCLHPVYAAKILSDSLRNSASTPSGLIQPMVLAGPGADKFCASIGIGILTRNDQLKTEATVKDYMKAKKFVSKQEVAQHITSSSIRLDTVGGVAVDVNGKCEACVSSGGILLKKEGRLGHSAQFGAAIWAEQCHKPNISVAVSLSGCGEALVRTHLAEILAQQVLLMDLDDIFLAQQISNFLDSSFLNSHRLSAFPRDRLLLGGLISVRQTGENPCAILIVFHNSSHFPFAFVGPDLKIRKYMSTIQTVGKFVCSLFPM